MDEVISLCKPVYTEDDIGNDIETLQKRDVFAEVLSITQAEFFAAAQAGIRPEYKFKIWAGEYDGENHVEYNGILYDIYRSYKLEDSRMELYCKSTVKTLGKE